ncbi:MAG TPA: hypothetical protein VMB05_00130 [Solirubrobacteraceae bacterium]|nr:hypothetical protein [Solirubrobacteraceae bacterium]
MRTLIATSGRRGRAIIVLLALVLGLRAASWAYWGAPSAGSASGKVSTLQAPTVASAEPGAGAVTLSWNAVTPPSAGTVRYYVTRDGGTPGGTCPSASSPSTVTSCTDSGASIASHSYTITAVWHSWTAKSSTASAQVTFGAATHLLLSPANANTIAGVADNLTITAQDAANNTVTSYTGARSLTFGGAGTIGANHPAVTSSAGSAVAFGNPTTINFSGGIATVSGAANGAMALYKAEAAKITVSDGTISSGSGASVTVSPASAASFSVPTPSTQTAGTAFEVTLTALDAFGNTATSYTGASKPISFSGPTNSPNGKAPVYPASVSFASGVGTAKGITLYNASATTALTAKEGSSISGSSGNFTVSPASAASFSVPTPSTQTAGTAFNVALTAKDEFGNLATGYTGEKTIAFSGPEASPAGSAPKYPASVVFSAGVGTANGITLYDAGNTTLEATQGTVKGVSANFTINGLSTTSKFLLSTPSPTAGKSFSETVTATDTYGNTTTSYTGNKTIGFTGPSSSPGGKAPKYPTGQINFASGVSTASITLYNAQTTTLTATQSTISGTSASFTVAPLSASEFGLGTPGAQTAGTAFNLTLTAKDEFGNVITGYEGAKVVTFSGPGTSPGGKVPSYPASVTFTAGVGIAAITLYDAQASTAIEAVQGSINDKTGNFAVNAAAMSALSLAASPTSFSPGESSELTITAVDGFGNTITSYTGSKNLTFGGAQTIGSNHPTVTNSSGAAIAFGSTTAISFSSGVASVSFGSRNGVMTLYKPETASITVTDGTFNNGSGLPVTVEASKISSLTLSNHAGGTKGKIEKDDTFSVGFSVPLAVNTFCSSWSGNSSSHELSGNGEVTVTLSDGAGTSDDTLTLSASKCTIHFGTIDLGSAGYVSGGNVTFSGNGSSASAIKYSPSSQKLTVELGGQAGTGTTKTVTTSAATLTPDANLTDEFGNAFAAFTIGTTAQF